MENSLNGEFILGAEKNTGNIKTTESKPITESPPLKNPIHFFSSFCQNPDGISFAEQENNEEILLLLRRHFITNIPWIAASIVLLFIPLLCPFIFANFPLPLPGPTTILFYILFYYLVIFGFITINFALWYFHVGLVTSQKLIDIDLSGILYRQISEASNRKIEDVTYTQIGFIRSLFNYGDVHVQTAGAESNILFDRVPRPSRVTEIIGDLNER